MMVYYSAVFNCCQKDTERHSKIQNFPNDFFFKLRKKKQSKKKKLTAPSEKRTQESWLSVCTCALLAFTANMQEEVVEAKKVTTPLNMQNKTAKQKQTKNSILKKRGKKRRRSQKGSIWFALNSTVLQSAPLDHHALPYHNVPVSLWA